VTDDVSSTESSSSTLFDSYLKIMFIFNTGSNRLSRGGLTGSPLPNYDVLQRKNSRMLVNWA
jgi:hypothetical protein